MSANLFNICLLCGAWCVTALGQPMSQSQGEQAILVNLDSASAPAELALGWLQGRTNHGWLRLRGVPLPQKGSKENGIESESSIQSVDKARENLSRLRSHGIKICVLLRWPAMDWKSKYLPQDLREVYERCCKLGETYGDLIDAWEVDNEPDLGFVPESAENYTAFLKAAYLGFKAGHKLRAKSYWLPNKNTPNQALVTSSAKTPLILMGSLGLPPGPWLERFAANDGFSYTDGYNYHYYGYAEDFTGVYRQHEAALRELGAGSLEPGAQSSKLVARSFPIFLTEVGYGMLGKKARDTKEGRLRQWGWFKSVGKQAADLQIEAPMAFQISPYLENNALEFGLTVSDRSQKPEISGQITAGKIAYTPADFGAGTAERWMGWIGKRIGEYEITPALAWWMAAPRAEEKPVSENLRYEAFGGHLDGMSQSANSTAESRSWAVSTLPPSPLVIDFAAGDGLLPLKRYGGSFVTAKSPEPAAVSREPKIKESEPKAGSSKLKARSEEFMIHVRTRNGNLYEVYPTRLATYEWQTYLEHRDNFTMSFYGRAELPWRFADNRPASLVLVMYPKALPAVYEFKRMQLIKLGRDVPGRLRESSRSVPPKSGRVVANAAENTGRTDMEASRFGSVRIIIYNFSDKPVSGRLVLTDQIEVVAISPEDAQPGNSLSAASVMLSLAPGERKELSAKVQIPAGSFERARTSIRFEPDDPAIPAARFQTEFFPALEGMEATVVAQLLPKERPGEIPKTEARRAVSTAPDNADFVRLRERTAEEAPMSEQNGLYVQHGAFVTRTLDGFAVTVTDTPPGKEQRVEVEIPWPAGVEFSHEAFLSVEFRLGSSAIHP